MGDGVVIAATCGGWAWENECSRNVVFDHTASWRHQNALYLHTVRPLALPRRWLCPLALPRGGALQRTDSVAA